MAVVEVCLIPIGTKETSVSKYVAEAEKILMAEGVKYKLNPMGTVIEADADKALEVIRKMQESVFDKGADRVYSVIKMDDRRDKNASMEQKIKSVEDKL
ncbi:MULTISPECIES: MTH1187 family thiamine-binding protein [Anaerococcus]|uniref:MTH1187 family thiamine-binding protein n=1 Tax=Anaerococcus TaxID=165779 RepID=UPI000CF96A42|nr:MULTISPECIES: MTH1187 family thiamine-binding protein [Anaerococcus]MDU5149507.1 MTH1187 family thiamine-binding protein [Anaerococcus prevotii]